MAVRDDFTAGEVLAAADLNDTFASKLPYSYGTATPSTTDSGFLWYDTNSAPPVPKYWNGSSFAALSAASALELVSTTTIGTTVTTVTVTGCFSADYENYKIIISDGTASNTSDGSFVLGSTTANYYNAGLYNSYNASSPLGFATSNQSASGTVFAYTANGLNLDMTIFRPFDTARTSWVFTASQMATVASQWAGGGFQDSATSFTSITFQTQGGHTLTGGTIRVYGIKD